MQGWAWWALRLVSERIPSSVELLNPRPVIRSRDRRPREVFIRMLSTCFSLNSEDTWNPCITSHMRINIKNVTLAYLFHLCNCYLSICFCAFWSINIKHEYCLIQELKIKNYDWVKWIFKYIFYKLIVWSLHLWWLHFQTVMSHLMTKPTKWHSPSLIRVFVFRMKKVWVLSYPLRE